MGREENEISAPQSNRIEEGGGYSFKLCSDTLLNFFFKILIISIHHNLYLWLNLGRIKIELKRVVVILLSCNSTG